MTAAPILFAHRGGRAHAPENTLAAFRSAVQRGADGVETDAFVTADGVVVLHHGGTVGKRRRKRSIAEMNRSELPDSIPTLDDLFDVVTSDHHVFIDVKGGGVRLVAAVVARRRPQNDPKVWLAHCGFNDSDWTQTASWRAVSPTVRLVDSTSVQRMQSHVPEYLARVGAAGIDCLNLPIAEWTPELVQLCRSVGLQTMAFRVHNRRRAAKALRLELDAVHGDNVDVLNRVFGRD